MRESIAATLIALVGLAVAPSGTVAAAEGDLWAVDRSNVNVRSGPSTNTDVLIRVNPGDRIVEIAAKGEWYFAEFPDYQKRGWIFGPLLVKPGAVQETAAEPAESIPTPAVATPTAAAEAPPEPSLDVSDDVQNQGLSDNALGASTAPSPVPTSVATAATGDEPAAVKTFRETVAELNERALSVAGIDLFSDVRSVGGGAIQVLTTDTWVNVPEAGQNSYMNALFDRWQSMAGGLGPLSLQIIDPRGQVMMERSGS